MTNDFKFNGDWSCKSGQIRKHECFNEFHLKPLGGRFYATNVSGPYAPKVFLLFFFTKIDKSNETWNNSQFARSWLSFNTDCYEQFDYCRLLKFNHDNWSLVIIKTSTIVYWRRPVLNTIIMTDSAPLALLHRQSIYQKYIYIICIL